MSLSLLCNDVPAYEVHEFSTKNTRYCFTPIVFNEGERLRRQITEMANNAELADIVIGERRSTDGSTDPAFLQQNGVNTLLTTNGSGGATAIRMVFSYALKRGYEGIILVDGNGKDDVAALPEFIRQLDENADFVQGSRFMRGGFHKNTPYLRHFGIRCVAAPLMWLSTGTWYTDAANGFRGYSRKFLTDKRVAPFRSCFVNYNLQFYLTYMAAKLKLKVVEVPVSRVYPQRGVVPTKVVGPKLNFMVFSELIFTVLGKYNP